jgi:membrane-bound metal-dependent hydrolase YbcI (DUF457 family)
MFIGHLALGFAAKRITPRVSLGMLLLASQWADSIWPLFVMLGIEQVRIDPGNTAFTPFDFVSYPYSHSLAALVIWGFLVGGAYRGIAGGRRSVAVLSALVISHWVLDFVTHRPDMPLYPGSAKYGMGLWNSVPLTLLVEFAMFAVGLFIYERATRARDAVGRWGLLALVGTVVLVYVATALGGPPPSSEAIGIAGLIGAVVMTTWAWWVDRHRDIIV